MVTMLRISTLLSLTVVIVAAGSNTNATSSHEHREPRATGRVVKLYSGSRPEPILCKGEGFQEDPHNCEVFYRCVKSGRGKYTVFRFRCGPGTVYDPDTEVCSHPGTTKRSECGGYLPSVVQTTHINEVESMQHDEIPSPIATYKPIYVANSTKNPTTVNEKRPLSTESTHLISTDDSYSLGTFNHPIYPENSASVYPMELTSTSRSSTRDNICTSDGFMGDSENCHKFYRCVANNRGGYTRYDYTCTEPTIWDEVYQTCNHVWAVKMGRCARHSNKVNEFDVPSLNKNPNYLNTGDLNNKSDISSQNQTQISHGSATSPSQTQIIYGQEGVQTQLPIDYSKNSSHTQVQITESTTLGNTQKVVSEKSKGTECTDIGFIGDPVDCHKFYRCVNNEKGGFSRIEFSCAEGTVWDPTIEACNHAWAVKECGSKGSKRPQHSLTTTIYKPSQAYYTTTTTENYANLLESVDTDNEDSYVTQKITSTVMASSLINTNTSSISVECTSSGFMADSNDCKVFYRCVESNSGSFIKYEFKCGEGTVWDPKIESCNYAWAVNTCGGNTLPDISKLETTTKKLLSTSVPMKSTTKTYLTSSIVQENDIDLKPGSVEHPPPDTEEDTGYLSNSNVIKPTATTQPIASDLQDSNDPSFCTSEGFIGDKYNCKIFYRCVSNGMGGFTRYTFDCSEGTLWDQTILSCNHPWAVSGCDDTGITTTPMQNITTTVTTGTVTTGTVTTGTVTTGTASTETVTTEASTNTTEDASIENNNHGDVVCSEEGFIRNPSNCKKFYRCVHDGKGAYIKYNFSCGEGTYWSQETLSCDHITSDKECGDIVNTSPTKTPQHEDVTISPEKNTISKDENYLTQKPPGPSGVCISEGMYGEKYDCKRFYRCVDNGNGGFTKYDFVCGDGTMWDQEIQVCNHESQAKCNGTSSGLQSSSGSQPSPQITPSMTDDQFGNNTFITTTTENRPTTSPTINQKPPPPLSSNNDCSSEGFCTGSVVQDQGNTETTSLSTMTSEYSSTITTPTQTSTTSGPTSKTTPPHTNSPNSCYEEGYFGDSQDCRKFYRCVSNGEGQYSKYDFICGEGTIWDQVVLSCNHPENVLRPSCQNGTSSNTSNENQDHDGSTTSQNAKFNCTKAGFYANPDDCKKFYRCVDWDGSGTRFSIFHFDCGEGTIWDPAVETCNYEQSVYPPRNCSGSQPQDVSTTESTTKKTTQLTTMSTTKSTTESITSDATEETVMSTVPMKTTTDSKETTTKTSTETTTIKSDETTTEHITTTEKSIESTTDNQETSTTERPEGSTTEKSTSETTQATTTEKLEQTTTEKSTTTTTDSTTTDSTTTDSTTTTSTPTASTTTASTTENSGGSTTEQLGESTTDQWQTSTTETSEGSTTAKSTTETTETTTTEKSEQTTTDKIPTTTTASTTENSTTETTEGSTTAKSSTETTERTTTEKSEQTTTDKIPTTTTASTTENSGGSTTEQLGESTTDQTSTTEKPDFSTTETSSDGTTEQSQSTTETLGTLTTQETSTQTTTTTSQPGEYTSTEATTDKNSTNTEPPDIDEGQYLLVCPSSFRRHPKYCNIFYQCDENEETHDVKIAMFTCPNNTMYDQTQTKCVEESKADKKCEGQMAQKRRVKRKGTIQDNGAIEVTEDSLACRFTGYFMFEKGNECSPGFLKCVKTKSKKLRGFVYQCPAGYIFWSVSKRCEPIRRVSDCKRSTINDWNNRWEIPIETKNVGWS